MVIAAGDVSVAVNGDIRWTGGATPNYTVLELHRFLQDLADNQTSSGDDLLDITSDTPSDRSTDNIITLLGTFNIDDTLAEHLFDGSITQASGDTVYSGLRVLGAVNNTATQLMVIQDNDSYQFTTTPSAPFWGTQATGGYNGNAVAGILMRILVKTRINGVDHDGKRVRVQARHWGDTYDFFNVTLGTGESVAAIGTTPDAQNSTLQATVTAYADVLNSGTTPIDAQDETSYDNAPATEGVFVGGTGYANLDVILMSDGSTVTVDLQSAGVITQFTVDSDTSRGAAAAVLLSQISVVPTGGSGFTMTPDVDNIAINPNIPRGGFQTINLNNGNGAQPYYSQWTFGARDLKALWEYTKDASGNGTAKTIDALIGENFLGITHEIDYDTEAGGPFIEHETLVWGTQITYDTLVAGPFTPGNLVTIGATAAGRVLHDSGTILTVALDDTSITLLNNDAITEFPGPGAAATTTTALINVTITDNGLAGGTGLLLALEDLGATGTVWVQLLTGVAPVNNLPLRGFHSSATALTNLAPVARTVPKIFTGSFTGTYIGAFGLGIESADLTANDTIQDLRGVTQTPPNNVTFSVTGAVIGEDYILVGPRTGALLLKAQDTHTALLTDNVTTSVIMTTAIPTDTPAAGTIRVEDDNLVFTRQPYTSFTASTYTLTAAYQGSNNANSAALTDVFISYIDKLATATTESFTSIFLATRDLFVRARDGGATPIKTFEASAQLTASGGTIALIRTTDA